MILASSPAAALEATLKRVRVWPVSVAAAEAFNVPSVSLANTLWPISAPAGKCAQKSPATANVMICPGRIWLPCADGYAVRAADERAFTRQHGSVRVVGSKIPRNGGGLVRFNCFLE